MITIVAVVAIVGLVTLFLNNGSNTGTLDTGNNLAGQGYYYKTPMYRTEPTGTDMPTTSPQERTAPTTTGSTLLR